MWIKKTETFEKQYLQKYENAKLIYQSCKQNYVYISYNNIFFAHCDFFDLHNTLHAQVGKDAGDSWAVDNLQAAYASDVKPLVGTHL